MNAVVADEQGNAQPRLLHQLVGAREVLRRGVQQGADGVLEHVLVHAVLGVQLEHLAHLLGERHAGDEVGYAVCDRQGRITKRFGHARQCSATPTVW